VQVCEKLHFLSTLTFVERGPQAGVGTAFGRSHVDAGCSFCGACVDHCPTGTLAEKTRKWEGVAETVVESICPYCAAGCSINLQVKKDTVIGATPGKDVSVNGGILCVHGRFGIPEMVNHTFRLRKPWKLVDGHHFEFPWEEAVEMAAEKLSDSSSPNKALQLASGLPVEDLYMAQKFAAKVLKLTGERGPVKKDGYARLLTHVTTFGKMRETDCVLLAGVDTRYTLSWLEYELKTLRRNGAQVISVNRQKRPLEQFANTYIDSGDNPAEILDQLASALKSNKGGISPIDQAAETLSESKNSVFLIDGSYLSDPELAKKLADIADKLNAEVICLPLQGNVFGALAAGARPFYGQATRPDVLYSIGCQPAVESGFTIYQNSFQPTVTAGLTLPSALFTERDGSFINAELRQRYFHKAVEPAGLALPDWQIIASIARKMGAAGFDFSSVEEIREEMAVTRPSSILKEAASAHSWLAHTGSPNDPVYLGAPLSSKVAGLKALLTTEHVKAGDL
jgi:predicted molibdopterin-dependent oxidoreductase YjgC